MDSSTAYRTHDGQGDDPQGVQTLDLGSSTWQGGMIKPR